MAGAPIIVSTSSGDGGVAGWTRRQYRQRLAREVGYFGTGLVTSQSAGPDALRQVLSTSFRSAFSPPERFDGLYLYLVDGTLAGAQRQLVDGGFEGQSGAFTTDDYYASLVDTGTRFEISELPAEEYLGAGGLNDAVNRALAQLPVVDYVSVTAVADQTEYPLTDYPFPIRGVREVVKPRASTTEERRVLLSGWRFEQDAELPILSLPHAYDEDDVFEVGLLRAANTWIKSAGSGAWADSTTGLAADGDSALYDIETVVQQAMPIALELLAQLHPRGSKERAVIRDEADVAGTAARWSRFFAGFRGSGAQRVGVGGGLG